MEVLRLDQFKRGEIGFVSLRASPTALIDLQPSAGSTHDSDNIDHFCLVVESTDMDKLMQELQSKGLKTQGPVAPSFGAQGRGPRFYTWDPDGNKIELRCYKDQGH